jgi:hypothetical protein
MQMYGLERCSGRCLLSIVFCSRPAVCVPVVWDLLFITAAAVLSAPNFAVEQQMGGCDPWHSFP